VDALVFGGMAAVFLTITLVTIWHIRWVPRLPELVSLPKASNESPVKCSMVIAARDEAARIEQTIRHLLAQRGVELELIVADDRSTDRTSKILKRLSKENQQVQLERVDVLPDGWLGKCHACHIGANAATADWILYGRFHRRMPID
jgi:cellulose synthase/poly-beta-1,6-N-acetylglucosamine synthase-like glycosyltransferase